MKPLLTLLTIFLFATGLSAQTLTKRELAKTVLTELGVASRFNVYLTSGADQVSGGAIQNPRMHQWMQGLWVQELGWTKVEDAYIAHFESKFSEAELKELLVLSKNPTVRKLLKEEVDAFKATLEQRNKNFAIFWRRYNALDFLPPDNVTK